MMAKPAHWIAAIALLVNAPGVAHTQDLGDGGAGLAPTAAMSSAGAARQPPGFVERFDPSTFGQRFYLSEHSVTGEWSAVEWRPAQVDFGANGAVISMAPAPEGAARPYMSGEIVSRGTYRYGYFEARFRMPRGGGLVSAFFTFARPGGEETWNEIDMELTGRDTRRIELVYHVAGEATLQVLELPFDAAAGFHTYAFEWMPDEIRWYLDNRLVHVSRGGRVAELTQPQQVFTSLWNSVRMPRWLGPVDSTQAPWRMDVSCVAYAPRYDGRSLCAPR